MSPQRGRRTQAHLRASKVWSGSRQTKEQIGFRTAAPCSQEHFFALRTAGGKQTSAQGAVAGCASAACPPTSKIVMIISSVSFITALLSDQSGLTPESLTTLAHFAVSSTMSLPKSAGEPDSTAAPSSASRAFILGSARTVLVSRLSRSIASAGVVFRAPMPYHWLRPEPRTSLGQLRTCRHGLQRVGRVNRQAS